VKGIRAVVYDWVWNLLEALAAVLALIASWIEAWSRVNDQMSHLDCFRVSG
jgi:hypothetical protein